MVLRHNNEKTIFKITSAISILEKAKSFELLVPIAPEWRSVIDTLNKNYIHKIFGNLNVNYDPDYIRVEVLENSLKEFSKRVI
jgi:hypothetical protein